MNFHREGLNAEQLYLLHQIGDLELPLEFYLAGGTALAAYFGHRQSVDLDWFTGSTIPDPLLFAQQLRDRGLDFTTRQTAPGTLNGSANNVQVTFLEFHYPLLQPLIAWEEMHVTLASLDDLACMKLSAIAQRGSKKDFIDLYALVSQHRPLAEMLPLYRKKFSVEDISPVLYGLAYFDEAEDEPSPLMLWDISWQKIKKSFTSWVKDLGRVE